ncbi:MAG TPA: VOC family protein [Acidimicrobiales bacterium]|nr:VOC family protein [Acidimicrobiales bacterium]
MARLRTYDPGVPSWVDVMCHDTAKAATFYRGLFGWEAVSQGPTEVTGGYAIFQLDGHDVAGIGPGEQPGWTTYITVADVEKTAALAAEHGAKVLTEPRTVPSPLTLTDAGRMALLADPEGAVFGVWQPADHTGADVTGEPGSLRWSELGVRDVEQAKAFYGALFGWEGETHPFADDTSTYTEFSLPGNDTKVAGMVQMNEQWPEEIPAHWMVYIAVADADAAAAQVVELGGTVSVEPFDLPNVGRIAVVNDVDGSVFSVMAPV